MFQHAAARRRLLVGVKTDKLKALFQHTAARRRLQVENMIRCAFREFQHTAARRRLLYIKNIEQLSMKVSTHSRAEAAALHQVQDLI